MLKSLLAEGRPLLADGALVLLDELAGGTDPREGEALAAGVLDSLCARGGAVVAFEHALPERRGAAADAEHVGTDLDMPVFFA